MLLAQLTLTQTGLDEEDKRGLIYCMAIAAHVCSLQHMVEQAKEASD